jgi:hypothetical protein
MTHTYLEEWLETKVKKEVKPNDLWYTPEYILEPVREVLGADYFDPCPIDPKFDGLDVVWGDKCFINPPYSKELKRAFVNKGIEEYKTDFKDNIEKEYIWLVNYANSKDLRWLKHYATGVCLPHERIKFIPGHESLNGGSPRYDQIILYWGDNVSAFAKAFRTIGKVF